MTTKPTKREILDFPNAEWEYPQVHLANGKTIDPVSVRQLVAWYHLSGQLDEDVKGGIDD